MTTTLLSKSFSPITEALALQIISPTDCVKDRLAHYYHWGDRQCLQQAILVAAKHDIDLKEIQEWSKSEGKFDEFEKIKKDLERG